MTGHYNILLYHISYTFEGAAVWLRWRTSTQWTWVQLPLIPIWVIGGGKKGVHPKCSRALVKVLPISGRHVRALEPHWIWMDDYAFIIFLGIEMHAVEVLLGSQLMCICRRFDAVEFGSDANHQCQQVLLSSGDRCRSDGIEQFSESCVAAVGRFTEHQRKRDRRVSSPFCCTFSLNLAAGLAKKEYAFDACYFIALTLLISWQKGILPVKNLAPTKVLLWNAYGRPELTWRDDWKMAWLTKDESSSSSISSSSTSSCLTIS